MSARTMIVKIKIMEDFLDGKATIITTIHLITFMKLWKKEMVLIMEGKLDGSLNFCFILYNN
jgi:hypothetical protein